MMTECKICFEDKEHQKQLPCQHTICLECLVKLTVTANQYQCPICKEVSLRQFVSVGDWPKFRCLHSFFRALKFLELKNLTIPLIQTQSKGSDFAAWSWGTLLTTPLNKLLQLHATIFYPVLTTKALQELYTQHSVSIHKLYVDCSQIINLHKV